MTIRENAIRIENSGLHEACHAYLAHAQGRTITRVEVHRGPEDGALGSVQWVKGTPFEDAVVWLGPSVFDAVGLEGTTDDERRAAERMPLGLHQARARAFELLATRRARAAVHALAEQLRETPEMDGGDVMRLLDSLV